MAENSHRGWLIALIVFVVAGLLIYKGLPAIRESSTEGEQPSMKKLSTQGEAFGNAITQYVIETGDGTITCHTAPLATVVFTHKSLKQIDAHLRPFVANGLKNGDCRAELSK